MKSHKPLPTFVQNRLKEISSHKDVKFRYISTSQNPADQATRGLTAEELVHSNLWWHGPSWLKDDMTKWPSSDFQQIDDDTLQQLAKNSAGAEVMYETSALTEIEGKIETNCPFRAERKGLFLSNQTSQSDSLVSAIHPKTLKEKY